MDWLREGTQCTKCGGSRFHYSGGCKICEENPYDKIKQLEAEIVKLQAKQFKDLAEIALKWEQKNQRLTEFIEKIVNADSMWADEWDEVKGSKSDTLRKQEE